MARKKDDVIKDLTAKGIAHDPSATVAELKALLKDEAGDTGAATAASTDTAAADATPADTGAAVKTDGKGVYYRLKQKSYMTDSKILPAGLYRFSKPVDRFEGQSTAYIEKFEGEIPEVLVYDIAKMFKVKTADSAGKLRPVKELLAEIVIDGDKA